MIELKVKDYCQECPAFDSTITNKLWADDKPILQIIECRNKGLCDQIKKHLEENLKGEQKND